jgi:uncharacterized membrane protein
MNSRRISLVLMAVNLGLIGAVAYLVFTLKSSPTGATGPVRTEIVTNTVTQIAVRKINATNNLLAALAGRPLSWRALESTNYVLYIENLRAFGCPEETIRDIIITDVAKLYARHRAELRRQLQPYQFWQPTDPVVGSAGSAEFQRQRRELDKAQRQLIRELLDVDLRAEMARYTSDGDDAERDYSFLPQDKQARVQSLSEQFDELEQDVYTRARGWLVDEDLEELKQLQRQRQAELASMLTSEELEEYELRHSDTADNLRGALGAFLPNEEEFRKIFKLQRTYDLEFDQGFDNRDHAAMEIRSRAAFQAGEALNSELAKTLGPERFAQYQRAQDGDYRALLQVTDRFGVSADVASRVFNMKQAAEAIKAQVESNPNLTDAQRAQAVAGIARQTERSVAAAMGNEVYDAYSKSSGDWLGSLAEIDESRVPRPPPPQGTVLPYDINILPADLRSYLLNPVLFPQVLQQPAK